MTYYQHKGITLIKMLGKVACAISLIGLQACSIFEPIKTQPMHYFTITAVPPLTYHHTHTAQKTILVTQPRSNAIYNNPRMIYIPACYQIQYFTQNRWADSPPQLLQPLLIKSLQHTGYFQAIINTPSTLRYDWILNTQLMSFQQEFLTKPSRFRIAMRAQLINNQLNRVVATQDFVVVQAAPYDDPYGGALAANLATQELLRRINHFCLKWIT